MITETNEPVLLMEPVTAWRVWAAGIVGNQWRLFSPLRPDGAMWEPHQPLEAQHDGLRITPYGWMCECRESPCNSYEDLSYGCGIYALKPSHATVLFDYAAKYSAPRFFDNGTALIVGAVWLWGRIVEHACGYRAQYGYPKGVCDYGSDWHSRHEFLRVRHRHEFLRVRRAVPEIAGAYGIPIISRPPHEG